MPGQHKILLLTHDLDACPERECSRIVTLLRAGLPEVETRVQEGVFVPPGGAAGPDLVLLRPSQDWALPQRLQSLRTHDGRAGIIGLYCAHRDARRIDPASFPQGMDDFVFCPYREMDLLPRIRRLLSERGASEPSPRSRPGGQRGKGEVMVGHSDSFLRMTGKIPLLANSEATVLLTGETGTGKDLVARAIHYQGPRRGKPFVPVNCGALPDQLFENELFGHARGAFTHAVSPEQGLVSEAEGGTLFFDEVETVSLSAQVKLLRFLQSREYRPLGSSRSLVADVRIIAATNADLKQRVELRQFREDLYYRLNVLPLSLPPLRERVEDIPLLAAHFLSRYGRRPGREVPGLSQEAIHKLCAYPWPGNVRELEGVMQRAAVLTSSSALQSGDIELMMAIGPDRGERGSMREAKSSAVRDFERAYLTRILIAAQGNITRAAKSAGKERRAFQRLLRKYGLERQAFQQTI